MKLKIGEFSRLNQVTVKTLRFYEEMELLTPVEIDPNSGYRYYDVAQMQVMGQIALLKRLGFALEEIKQMFDNGNKVPTSQMIAQKLQTCRESLEILKQRELELKNFQKQLRSTEIMEKFTIKSLPAITVASHRRIINSYGELFDLCPNVIGPEMARLGCVCSEPGYCYTIDHNKEYRETTIDIEYCEAVTEKKQDTKLIQFKDIPAVEQAICFNHYGSYESFPQSWTEIYTYLESNGYKVADFPRFCYIDGIWNKEDESEWLTQIQVPIKKAK